MSYLETGLIGAVFTLVSFFIASLLSEFKTWKLFIVLNFIITISTATYIILKRKSINNGVDGAWGAKGIGPEIFDLEIWLVGFGVGVSLSLLILLAIYAENIGRR